MGEIDRNDEIQGKIVHEYDGIEEADNDLPKWWLYTLVGSILFSVGYWFVYHEFHLAPSAAETYVAELTERNSRFPPVTEEVLLAARDDEAAIERGRQIFASSCMQCHLDRGQGQIGPNLTDGYWLHGGAPLQIHDSIKNGVLTKGMPAWGSLLGPRGVTSVAAFVLSIRDTNVQGKEPQGERWPPEPSAPATPAADTPAEATPSDPAAEHPTPGEPGATEPPTSAALPPPEGVTLVVNDPVAAAEPSGAPAPSPATPIP
jgi:cytochrome c oxidase cbb3-type subunit III